MSFIFQHLRLLIEEKYTLLFITNDTNALYTIKSHVNKGRKS